MRHPSQDARFSDSVTYRYDFFSGANVGLWMGSTLVSEAVGIEFSLSQTKRPIWGWASQLYDGVASGVVQCSGMMYMNFRQAHLLTALIDQAQHVTYKDHEGDDALLKDAANYPGASYDLPNMEPGQIEDLKALYWAQDVDLIHKSPYGNPRPQDIGNTASGYRRPDAHGTGFDIQITYGDYFGGRGNATTRILSNVHITGFGQTLQIDGNPVLEVYPFFCREAR